jgi:hypothetical protein
MSRVLDVNELFTGSEPKLQRQLSNAELGSILSWYSQNKTKKDATKYAVDYFKKKLKIRVEPVLLKAVASTFGFVCRIVTNGATLSDKDQEWFSKEIEGVKTRQSNVKVDVEVEDKTKPNIQDRIKEKSSMCIGELEGMVDDYCESNFSREMSPIAMMQNMEIKTVHVRFILDWAKRKRGEFDSVLNTDDKDIKEGYSNFKKVGLKKLVSFFDQVILDCGKINVASTATRKPRKRKVKTPQELVTKVVICKEFDELKLKSVAPTEIIGASQLWVYNTKNKKLGVYNAEDAGGFSVKGTTITNFSEEKSTQKTLRKPAEMLPEVLKGGKVFLRNVLTNIRAVESKLNGRLNKDIVLLKVVK